MVTPSPARLRVVDAETGEVHDHCPECKVKDDEIKGHQRDLKGWMARYYDLKRDKDREAREHALWPEAKRLFNEWKERCRHPKSEFDADRFWAVEPFLRKHGFDICLKAIKGAEFDPWTTRRKNGSENRHDRWGLIFENSDKFESFVNRAPLKETA